MVGEVDIELTGMEELEKVLRQMPDGLAERDLASALRKGANVVRDEAQKNAPVDDGDLKDSIKVRKQKSGKGEAAVIVAPTKPAGFHAHFIEFGTVKQPAQPFLRPAFDSKQNEALEVIITSLAKKVEKTALKLSGNFKKSGLAKRKRRR